MNINTEYADERTGRMKDSNIRATVRGISNIQKYCKENIIYEDKLNNITFMQKFRKKESRDGDALRPIDFHDFHFRVNYKSERNLTPNDRFPIKPEVVQMIDNWRDTKKPFVLLKDTHLKCEGK